MSPQARTSRTMRMVACYSCQGHAAEEVSPLTRHTGGSGFREEVNGLGATATAARLSRRAGRPKTRHAEDGVAILRALAEADGYGRVICKYSRNREKKISSAPGPGPGHGQRFRARGSASGREIAARGSLGGRLIGPCF